MKKRIMSLALALTMVVSLVACGSGESSSTASTGTPTTSEEPIVMKVAGTFNDESFMGVYLHDYFKPYVEEHSDGRISVEIYTNSVLGSDRELVEGMQMNTVQAAIAPVNVIANFNMPKLNALSMPYLFESREDAYEQLDGEFGDYMAEGLETIGLRSLRWGESAIRNLSSSKKAIRTPEDCEGQKFRVMEAAIDIAIIEALGGSPTPMAFNELYTGLQQGTVDGQDNGLVMTYNMKFYEVQDYYTVTEQYFLANGFIVSEIFWQSLPDDLKQVVQDGADYAMEAGREIVVQQENECIPIMEEAGMEIIYLTDEEKAAFKEATSSVWDNIEELVQDEKAIEMALELYNR